MICYKCHIDKKEEEFCKRKGTTSQPCKKCNSDANKKYYSKYPERRNETIKKWRKAHNSWNEYQREYRNRRSKDDPIWKAKEIARGVIKASFRRAVNGRYRKSIKTEEILGCSMLDFKTYIESQFIEHMTWENYGEWHIDHRIPVSLATSESDIIKLNHFSNLQPMWAKDNFIKGNKYDESSLNSFVHRNADSGV